MLALDLAPLATETPIHAPQPAHEQASRHKVPVPEIDAQVPGSVTKTLTAKEPVFIEGDRKTHVYKVETGVVCVYKLLADGRRQVIDFAYPGDLIGLGCQDTHLFGAEAAAPTRLRCIPAGALNHLFHQDPRMAQLLYNAVSMELAAARDMLMTVCRRSALERVASFLVALSRRNERTGDDPFTVTLPMTRSHIADFLGLTIETVSRTITKLRTMHLIELRKTTCLRILDIEALERLASSEEQVH